MLLPPSKGIKAPSSSSPSPRYSPLFDLMRTMLLVPLLLLPFPSSPSVALASKCSVRQPRSCDLEEAHPLYMSTCVKNTDWNYYNVARELKRWIRSIRVVSQSTLPLPWRTSDSLLSRGANQDPVEMPREVAVAFHDEGDPPDGPDPHLDFIGRVNTRGFAVGNFWTSMGYSDSSPFNNGFLYGPLDEKGEMSGGQYQDFYATLALLLLSFDLSNC